MIDSSICLGGSGCNCVGGRIGDLCLLTVVGSVVILLLLCCCCCVCLLCLKAEGPESKEMPLLCSDSANPAKSKKRRSKKKIIFFSFFAVVALCLVGTYYIDFGINLWHLYSVEVSPGLGVTAGMYAVDTLTNRFWAEAGIQDFDIQIWCSNDELSTKLFGKCQEIPDYFTWVSCQDLIEYLVPEIPDNAVRSSTKKSVPALIGKRKCVVYEDGDSSWCSINGQIFERCEGSACIQFTKHKRILGISEFTCK
ncbi:hypothetical protein P9112_012569 [Eukaryota sp. TZLM1-RC]